MKIKYFCEKKKKYKVILHRAGLSFLGGSDEQRSVGHGLLGEADPRPRHASSEMDKLTSNKEDEEVLIMASVARDSAENVKRRQRINTLYLASEEAMQTASAFPAAMAIGTSASTAFMDVLPVIRNMLNSEDFRSKNNHNQKNSRRSRNPERFIHYFDTINICLTQNHLEALKKPFFSYV